MICYINLREMKIWEIEIFLFIFNDGRSWYKSNYKGRVANYRNFVVVTGFPHHPELLDSPFGCFLMSM